MGRARVTCVAWRVSSDCAGGSGGGACDDDSGMMYSMAGGSGSEGARTYVAAAHWASRVFRRGAVARERAVCVGGVGLCERRAQSVGVVSAVTAGGVTAERCRAWRAKSLPFGGLAFRNHRPQGVRALWREHGAGRLGRFHVGSAAGGGTLDDVYNAVSRSLVHKMYSTYSANSGLFT